MKISEINPFIRYAQDVRICPTGSVFFSYDCRLIYLREGKMTVRCGEHRHEMSGGSIAFWQGGIPYAFEFTNRLSIYVFDFDLTQHFAHLGESLHTVTADKYVPEQTIPRRRFEECPELNEFLAVDDMQSYEADLRFIINELRSEKRFCHEIASATLQRVMIQAVRTSLSNARSIDTMEHIIAYIRDNYHKPIGNADIAKAMHYHVTSLNTLVSAQTGMSLHQYLLKYRLSRSADLLTNTDLQISELADRCGFQSCSYFCRVFKEHFGETPLKYRHRHKWIV